MRPPARARSAPKRAGSDYSSSDDCETRPPSAKRVCQLPHSFSSASIASLASTAVPSEPASPDAAQGAAHPPDVESALCEIFDAAPSTVSASIAGSLSVTLEPTQAELHTPQAGTVSGDTTPLVRTPSAAGSALDAEIERSGLDRVAFDSGLMLMGDEVGASAWEGDEIDFAGTITAQMMGGSGTDEFFAASELSISDLIGSLDGKAALAAATAATAGAGAEAKPSKAGASEGTAGGGAPPNRKEWAASEDEAIRNGVMLLGTRWRAIAAMLPGRSDDAVRNRWARLQNASAGKPASAPRVKREGAEQRQSWTPEEDAVITSSVTEFGHRWNRIAERLPKRTEHAIRNRWHRLQTLALEGASAGRASPTPEPASAAGLSFDFAQAILVG